LHIPQLKEPENILPTLTAAQVTRLVTWKPKPKHFYQRRVHLLTLLLLLTAEYILRFVYFGPPSHDRHDSTGE
jgi:hypothetical protein